MARKVELSQRVVLYIHINSYISSMAKAVSSLGYITVDTAMQLSPRDLLNVLYAVLPVVNNVIKNKDCLI